MSVIYKLIPKSVKNKIKKKLYNDFKNNLRNTEVSYRVSYNDKNKFDNKIAIITGGSGAIGSAICFKLATEGAIVYVAGRNLKNINSVIEQIKKNNCEAYPLIMNITDHKDIENKIKKVYTTHGKIDILVNNAGGSAREKKKDFINQDIEIIDNILNTNLRGTMLCTKEVLKYMKEKEYGRIVNIGSVMGVQGAVKYTDYAASKAGIEGFTKSLAIEVIKNGITVNCVSPGLTNQIIWDECLDETKTKGNYIGRTAKTMEVANAIEFFCREENGYITGQNLIVDGGRSLGLKGE